MNEEDVRRLWDGDVPREVQLGLMERDHISPACSVRRLRDWNMMRR